MFCSFNRVRATRAKGFSYTISAYKLFRANTKFKTLLIEIYDNIQNNASENCDDNNVNNVQHDRRLITRTSEAVKRRPSVVINQHPENENVCLRK